MKSTTIIAIITTIVQTFKFLIFCNLLTKILTAKYSIIANTIAIIPVPLDWYLAV